MNGLSYNSYKKLIKVFHSFMNRSIIMDYCYNVDWSSSRLLNFFLSSTYIVALSLGIGVLFAFFANQHFFLTIPTNDKHKHTHIYIQIYIYIYIYMCVCVCVCV